MASLQTHDIQSRGLGSYASESWLGRPSASNTAWPCQLTYIKSAPPLTCAAAIGPCPGGRAHATLDIASGRSPRRLRVSALSETTDLTRPLTLHRPPLCISGRPGARHGVGLRAPLHLAHGLRATALLPLLLVLVKFIIFVPAGSESLIIQCTRRRRWRGSTDAAKAATPGGGRWHRRRRGKRGRGRDRD